MSAPLTGHDLLDLLEGRESPPYPRTLRHREGGGAHGLAIATRLLSALARAMFLLEAIAGRLDLVTPPAPGGTQGDLRLAVWATQRWTTTSCARTDWRAYAPALPGHLHPRVFAANGTWQERDSMGLADAGWEKGFTSEARALAAARAVPWWPEVKA